MSDLRTPPEAAPSSSPSERSGGDSVTPQNENPGDGRAVSAEVVHPVFLTGEDGEPIWIRADVFANTKEALLAYNHKYDAGWGLNTPATDAHMRSAPERSPWDPDPEWHETASEPAENTALYWRFDV